jgi:hypothetical protein
MPLPNPPRRGTLIDQFVGDREERFWYNEAERSSRLQVEDELQFGRLHDWQVGGPRTANSMKSSSIVSIVVAPFVVAVARQGFGCGGR